MNVSNIFASVDEVAMLDMRDCSKGCDLFGEYMYYKSKKHFEDVAMVVPKIKETRLY